MSTQHTVREIDHTVRVDLTDAPPMRTADGRRRKPYGLRIRYGVTPGIARVDVAVEYRDAAETFPPVGDMPTWMREIVDEHRPRDVDHPDTDRRTGMGGWPLEPFTPVSQQPATDSLTTLTAPALLATIKELRDLRAPLTAALATVYRSMTSCVGDEWAMEWLGEVWTQIPLDVRALAGDRDAADELAEERNR